MLELATVLAGPGVGMFLAELGARVVKIEPPQGDVTRTWRQPGESKSISAYFASVNWGKESIVLDFNQDADRNLFYKLLREADILLSSYKKGDDLKFGLQPDALLEQNPKLIIGRISGYGQEQDRVAYDAVLQAETGYMYMNREADASYIKMPVALIDVLAAHQLKEGILLKLLQRSTGGSGGIVDVSLYDTAISSLSNQATNWLQAGLDPKPLGTEHPNIFPYGTLFQSLDGIDFIVALSTNRQFYAFCDIIGFVPSAELHGSNPLRVQNRHSLGDALRELVSGINWPFLESEMSKAKLPFGKIRPVSEVFNDQKANELVYSNGFLKGLKQAVFQEKAGLSPPPELDAHRAAILEWLEQLP